MSLTVPLARRFNTAQISANTDVFSDDLDPQTQRSLMRITVAVDSPSQILVTERENGDTVSYRLNAGAEIDAGDVYTFDLPIRGVASYNIQFASNVSVLTINVDEIMEN
jgi:hypothetical protein